MTLKSKGMTPIKSPDRYTGMGHSLKKGPTKHTYKGWLEIALRKVL